MTNAKRILRGEGWYLFFLLPAVCLFILAVVVPLAMGARYSFSSWDGVSPTIAYNGWDNYVKAFQDKDLWRALWNTFKYAIILTILINALSLFLALLLDSYLKFRNVFRTVFFLPSVISIVLSGFVWNYNYSQGFPKLFAYFGVDMTSPLGNPDYAMIGLIIVALWQGIGSPMIIYIAGLQGIPGELLESAKMDGATTWKSFRHITFPLLAPSLTINLLLVMTGALKVFDLVYVTTKGGPGFATEVMSTYIYRTSFDNFKAGYGMTLSMIFFLVLVIVTVAQVGIFRRREVDL
ncbi:carbohydrate ABC transporter permease [Paenibacillus gorillae]|uniref:carbohydrate ABC transporter permease n=1 Tax=Paenibacillus gorillae TaxID=1243662 RepID=UPI0004B39E92|nr:sugar ABC transporter permease [Paenibacillus gorillae]